MNLPIVKVPYSARNPNFKAIPNKDGITTNMDEYRLPERLYDAEVLSLHLNTGKMQVRLFEKQDNYFGDKETITFVISNALFFEKHKIVDI